MAIATWIILGIVAGLMAHRRFHSSGQGIFMDIVLNPGVARNLALGVAGGVLGGWATNSVATSGHVVSTLANPLVSLLVNYAVNLLAAVFSANAVLGLYHLLARRDRHSREATKT
ncbi:hypothetical protein [Viridibacterium curvum]|uniref:Fluoride ion transporter CrcB n=1 Tax=Viridibacterium curvum TaxID=1101404 RepID=A0ABP9QNY6_9RHOO